MNPECVGSTPTSVAIIIKLIIKIAKGKPKRDGSGKGSRANQGRGGCSPTKKRMGKSDLVEEDDEIDVKIFFSMVTVA